MASDALHLGARVLLSPGHSHLSGFRSDSKHQDFALLSKGCARVCMCMCESSKDLWLAWSSVLRPALKLGSARPAICYPAHISKANSAPKPGQQKLRIPGVCAVCVCVCGVFSPPQGISMCEQGVGLHEGPLPRAENRYPEQGASVVLLHDVPPGSPSLGWVPNAFCLADTYIFNTLM